MNNIILTIVCTTYNHENYIEKTLNSFVQQQTKYAYKVIIHDDASTDSTPKIIDDFVEKYPSTFIVIHQEKNQYSQGVDIFATFIQPLINTKYTALCEGDDYWVDSNKIQLQIEYLEQHPEYSMCVHNTVKINEVGKSLNIYTSDINIKDRDIGIQEIIETCGNTAFHTSSFIFRSCIRQKMPEIFSKLPVGDYPLAIYMALNGKIHYIAKVMSAYRVMAKGSWSEKNISNKRISYLISCQMIKGIKIIDDFTNYKYTKSFKKVIVAHEYNNIILQKKYSQIIKKRSYLLIFAKRLIPRFIKTFLKQLIYNE